MLVRTQQVCLLALCRGFAQLNRVATSFLVVPMSKDLSMDVSMKATLVFAFYYGYTFMQIPGGMLAQKFGPKKAMFGAVLLNGLFIFLVPFVAEMSTWMIVLCITVCGLAQGPETPSNSAMMAAWIPKAERAWAVGLSDSGVFCGQALAGFVCPTLALLFGWRATYMVLGIGEMITAFIWIQYAVDKPTDIAGTPRLTKQELLDIQGETKQPSTASKETSANDDKDDEFEMVSEKDGEERKRSKFEKEAEKLKEYVEGKVRKNNMPLYLLKHPAVWAIILGHVAHNYLRHVSSWLPTYFDEVLKVSPTQAGSLLFFPEIFSVGVRFACGWASQNLAQKGWRLQKQRQLFSCLGFFGTVAGILAFLTSNHVMLTVLILCFVSCISALHTAGYRANYLDMTVKDAAFLSAFGNMMANAPGLLLPSISSTLYMLFGSWSPLFLTVAVVNFLVGCYYYVFVSDQMIMRPEDEAKKKD